VFHSSFLKNVQFQYYGTGLLSSYDKYPDNRFPGGKTMQENLFSKASDSGTPWPKSKRGRKPLKRENSFNESLVM